MRNNDNHVYFFDVWYVFQDQNEDNHYFHIGYFSSRKKAIEAIESVKYKSGFYDTDGDFSISRIRVYHNQSNFKKENCNLFILYHEFLDEEGYENSTIWGPFSSNLEAEKAYSENKNKAPYCLHPHNFEICDQKSDLCGWSEGFVSNE